MFPQPPQFCGSVSYSTGSRQVPAQNERPIAMHVVSMQTPSTQRAFMKPIVVQLLPHAPQFCT